MKKINLIGLCFLFLTIPAFSAESESKRIKELEDENQRLKESIVKVSNENLKLKASIRELEKKVKETPEKETKAATESAKPKKQAVKNRKIYEFKDLYEDLRDYASLGNAIKQKTRENELQEKYLNTTIKIENAILQSIKILKTTPKEVKEFGDFQYRVLVKHYFNPENGNIEKGLSRKIGRNKFFYFEIYTNNQKELEKLKNKDTITFYGKPCFFFLSKRFNPNTELNRPPKVSEIKLYDAKITK